MMPPNLIHFFHPEKTNLTFTALICGPLRCLEQKNAQKKKDSYQMVDVRNGDESHKIFKNRIC